MSNYNSLFKNFRRMGFFVEGIRAGSSFKQATCVCLVSGTSIKLKERGWKKIIRYFTNCCYVRALCLIDWFKIFETNFNIYIYRSQARIYSMFNLILWIRSILGWSSTHTSKITFRLGLIACVLYNTLYFFIWSDKI